MVSRNSAIDLTYWSIASNAVPSGAVMLIRTLLLSSIGASSEGIFIPIQKMITIEMAIIRNAIHRCVINLRSDRLYPSFKRSNCLSDQRYSRLSDVDFFNIREHIIGVRVSDTKADMMTEPATVTANSRNKRPVKPPRKIMGRNTAARVIVVEIIAKIISSEPLWPATIGFSPASIFL